jgi:hypothetical protein
MKRILPSYVASLKELSSLPDEFERRFWVCRVEGLLQTVKADYEIFQAKAQEVDFVSKFMTLGIDMVLKARGMEPVPPQEHPRLGISLSSPGKIEPDWIDNPNREPEAIFVTYEEFVAIAQRLEGKLLEGTIVPSSEDEIPKLVYSSALELVEGDKQ